MLYGNNGFGIVQLRHVRVENAHPVKAAGFRLSNFHSDDMNTIYPTVLDVVNHLAEQFVDVVMVCKGSSADLEHVADFGDVRPVRSEHIYRLSFLNPMK